MSALDNSRTTHASSDQEAPTTNPDFSVAGPNPAFTQASPPPPVPARNSADAERDRRINELEYLLAEATKRIERGTAALEQARQRRVRAPFAG